MKRYDIVFVIGYHRSAYILLGLVNQFSNIKNVAVIFYEDDQELHQKTGRYKQRIIQDLRIKCDIIDAGDKFTAELLIIQQFNYTTNFLDVLKLSANFKQDYIVMSFASTGLANFDEVIEKFPTATLLTQDSTFLYILCKKRNVSSIQGRNVLEIGLPAFDVDLKNKPLFDWMILAPTTFSLQTLRARNNFLYNAIQFILQNPSDYYVYKEHNGNHRDSLGLFVLPSFIRNLILKTSIINLMVYIFYNNKSEKGKYKALFLNLLLRLDLSCRVVKLSQYHKNAHQAAEEFMPNIRKGLLGGYSNTIWAASYYNKKYINLSSEDDYQKIYENPKSRKLLGVNLDYILAEKPLGPRFILNTNEDIQKIRTTKIDIIKLLLGKL